MCIRDSLRALVGSIGLVGDVAFCVMPAALLRAATEQMRSDDGGTLGIILLSTLVTMALSRALETSIGVVRRRRREESGRLRTAAAASGDTAEGSQAVPRTFGESFLAWRRSTGSRWLPDGSHGPTRSTRRSTRTGSHRVAVLGQCASISHLGRSTHLQRSARAERRQAGAARCA